MDENDKPDGSTAMERLCRELMDKIESNAATSWCREHGYNVKGTSYTEDKRNARADIERRINEADLEDDRARDSALGWYKAKADELDALREAGRIVPEGVSWPRFEDGSPVRFGDYVEIDGKEIEVRRVEMCRGWCVVDQDVNTYDKKPHGERFKRPDPKAIGADGVEVKPGDTVWLAPERRGMAQRGTRESGDTCGLSGVDALDRLAVVYTRDRSGVPIASLDRCQAWCPASWLTHTAPCTDKDGAPIDEGDEVWTEDGCRWKVLGIKDGGHPVQAKCVEGCHRGKRRDLKWTWVSHERPDSWERLHEDVRKVYTDYWGCIGLRCDECPALVDGKDPSERYDTIWCDTAMRFDLVARAERLAGVQGE